MSHPVFLEYRKKEILELLRDQNVRTVVLSGEAEVGKTWMAREVSEFAILKGLYDATLWIIPKYLTDRRSLAKTIFLQLSAYPFTNVEREDVDSNADVVEEQKVDLETMKKLILKKLEEMRFGKPEHEGEINIDWTNATLKKLHFLIVLDDIPETHEDGISRELNTLFPVEHGDFKFLVTRRRSKGTFASRIPTIINDKTRLYRMEFLSSDESLDLLKHTVKIEVSNARDFDRLSKAIVKGSLGHPGVIVTVAKTLNHLGNLELEIAIEEAASRIESADTTPNANMVTGLMQYVYKMLPSPTISNCAWYCQYLFQQHGSIHFNELITYWLMEGYFEHHDHIKVAYREAHLVLMELLDRGILREEDNYVSMESNAMKLPDYRRLGLSGSACLGLPSVLNGANWEGLGRITQTNGMIKGSHLTENEISTLLIDGSRFCREVPEKFSLSEKFFKLGKLKVLVILNPKFKELPQIFSELTEIQVLILRACTQLEIVDEIRNLAQLIVLEISGARLLNELDSNFFVEMANLRSVNLSEAGIQSLPYSLLHQPELRWLILRRCLNLEIEYGQIFPLKLEVLDLSGSTMIRIIGRRMNLENLQTLNISRTNIERLPFFGDMPNLSRLILCDCQYLLRLPTLKELSNLEILDCSNSKCLKVVQPYSLKVKFLDLSCCPVSDLPHDINNQSHILLKDCRELEQLPSTKALEDLEVLDLSNASNFVKFGDESFEHLKSLRQLNLSKTIIKELPSLSPLTELRQLLLKDCTHLKYLLGLSTLAKLEVLDLSGCHNLVIRVNESFKNMSYLKILNLSHTKVTSLPSDCFPKSLRQLILRDCIDLKELPSLESLFDLEVLDLCGLKSFNSKESKCIKDMTKLRRLDLSGVVVDEFPSLANLTNLTELSLRGRSCKVSELGIFEKPETLSNLRKLSLGGFVDLGDFNLTLLSKLEDLDLFEIERKEYPYEISELTGLRKLRLQVKKKITEIDWKRIKYIPEYFELGDCGSRSVENDSIQVDCSPNSTPYNFPSIMIFGTGFFKFLEDRNDSQLWDKCFDRFHFSVWLSREEDDKQVDERAYHLRERALLRDIKSQSRVPQSGGYHTDLKRYLEIHGSYGLLSPYKDVLTHADHISLIDDSFIAGIFMIGVDILKSKKSCWLERCEKIRCVIDVEEEPTALEKLENLYLYNLSSLEYMCGHDLQSRVFMTLKSLFIECCPKLDKIFHFSQLPENLETLEIKFCDGMEMLFYPEETAKCNLQNLHMIGLPNLKIIGAVFLSLKKLKVRGCPKLSSITVPDECEVVDDDQKLQIVYLPK